MSSQYSTNYIGSDYVDLGRKLITKDYLNNVYLSLSNTIITPELWGWGLNTYGQLGDNTTSLRDTPVTTFSGGSNWKQISCGKSHIGAIKSDGSLWTWGFNNIGQLGLGQSGFNIKTPTQTFGEGTDWVQISCGTNHTAAIKRDGSLWTWGGNSYGQLGINNYSSIRITPVTTFTGGDNNNWKKVSCGEYFTAAIKIDGTLWSWGKGDEGQLGVLRFARAQSNTVPIPYEVSEDLTWKNVPNTNASSLFTMSSGNSHGAAIKTDGTLWLWGKNDYGQLGTNNTAYKSTPVTTFAGGTTWRQVVCGRYITAAIKTDGTLWLWGENPSGQLGVGDQVSRSTPVTTFAGGTNWSNISLGSACAMAVKTDGTLWCWGSSVNGKIPINSNILTVQTPVTTFAGGTDWAQVSMGSAHGAAVKTDGTLWTWGTNSYGQLGAGDVGNVRFTPITTFAGGTTWKQVSCGFFNTGAVKTDSTIWVWGDDTYGKLGRGTYATNQPIPVTPINGGVGVWKQISCGNAHIAAVKYDGTLWTWGLNNNGQLGIDFTPGLTWRVTPVTTFAGGTNWSQVHTTDSGTTLAVKSNGSLWTWGFNSSLAFGLSQKTSVPEEVYTLGNVNWSNISCGPTQSAAISSTGNIWMWGNGFLGSTGNRSATPKQIFGGGTDWKQVSCGYKHTAAVKTDGTLWLWGASTFGRLGNNIDATNYITPITTFAGGSNWRQVACGMYSTAAVKSDGTLWTWGYNIYRQLGDNTNFQKLTPITTFAGGSEWKSVSCGQYFTFGIKSIDDV